MVIHRVKRDEPYIDKLRTALNIFVQTLALMREKLELEHGVFPPIVIPQPLADDDPGALGVGSRRGTTDDRQWITGGCEMDRRKQDPVERAFAAYRELTPEQRGLFAAYVAGYNQATAPKEPPAPRKRKAKQEVQNG